jgi:hypothetical protein
MSTGDKASGDSVVLSAIPYAAIPFELLKQSSKDGMPLAAIVAGLLLQHASKDGAAKATAWRSNDNLIRDTGTSKSTIERAITWLIENRWIERKAYGAFENGNNTGREFALLWRRPDFKKPEYETKKKPKRGQKKAAPREKTETSRQIAPVIEQPRQSSPATYTADQLRERMNDFRFDLEINVDNIAKSPRQKFDEPLDKLIQKTANMLASFLFDNRSSTNYMKQLWRLVKGKHNRERIRHPKEFLEALDYITGSWAQRMQSPKLKYNLGIQFNRVLEEFDTGQRELSDDH